MDKVFRHRDVQSGEGILMSAEDLHSHEAGTGRHQGGEDLGSRV